MMPPGADSRLLVFRDENEASYFFVDADTDDVDKLRRHYRAALDLLVGSWAGMRDLKNQLEAAREKIARG